MTQGGGPHVSLEKLGEAAMKSADESVRRMLDIF